MTHSFVASTALPTPSQFLFNSSVRVQLVQRTQEGDSNSSLTEVTLRIQEKRDEKSGEKYFRFELSKWDQHDFLYAENVTREKFQLIAKECQLNADFENFPHRLIEEVLNKKSERREPTVHEIEEFDSPSPAHAGAAARDEPRIQLNVLLAPDRANCEFESVRITRLHRLRTAIRMHAVRGEELLTHVIQLCKINENKLRKYKTENEQLHVRLKRLGKESDDRAKEIERLILQVTNNYFRRASELENLNKEYEELQTAYQDSQSELELAQEELQNFREDKNELEEQVKSLESDVAAAEREIRKRDIQLDEVEKIFNEFKSDFQTLKSEKAELEHDYEKAKYVIRTYHKNGSNLEITASGITSLAGKSLDAKKLTELDTELKEKAQLCDELQSQVSVLKGEMEKLSSETCEKDRLIAQLKRDREDAVKALTIYQARCGPLTSVGSAAPSPLYYTPPQQLLGPRYQSNMAASGGPIPYPAAAFRNNTPTYKPVLGQGASPALLNAYGGTASLPRPPLSNLTANANIHPLNAHPTPPSRHSNTAQNGQTNDGSLHSLQPNNTKNIT